MDGNGLVEIRDIGCLTVLKLKGIQPAKVRTAEINNKRRAVFLFHEHELGSLVDDYFQHKIQVDAREFTGVMKKLKEDIYEAKMVSYSEGRDGKEGLRKT